MRTVCNWIMVIALAMLGLSASGCPILMIPGLAYSGYQYEKTGSITGQPAAKSSASNSNQPAAQSTPSSNNIE